MSQLLRDTLIQVCQLTEQDKQTLIRQQLCYLEENGIKLDDEELSEHIQAFLETAQKAIILGRCLQMATKNVLRVEWDGKRGEFAFSLNTEGLLE